MRFPVDLGGGFSLGELAEHHATELNRATVHNLSRLREWEAWAHEDQTLAHTEAHIRQRLSARSQGLAMPCLIMRGSRVFGTVDLRIDPGKRSGEIGYWLDSEATGQGLATRATETLVQHAREISLHHVRLRISEMNTKSIAVADRLGFTLNGPAPERMLVGSHRHTMLVYISGPLCAG